VCGAIGVTAVAGAAAVGGGHHIRVAGELPLPGVVGWGRQQSRLLTTDTATAEHALKPLLPPPL